MRDRGSRLLSLREDDIVAAKLFLDSLALSHFCGKLYLHLFFLNSEIGSPAISSPLNTWVRFSPFTWINSSHLQFVKGSLAATSMKGDNWIELILLADFSCYLKGLWEEWHSEKKKALFNLLQRAILDEEYESVIRVTGGRRERAAVIVCERSVGLGFPAGCLQWRSD